MTEFRNKSASGICFLICLFLGLVLLKPLPVFADGVSVPCVMTGEDVGNGYEYSVPGIGTFSVNGKDGATFEAAVFDFGKGLYPSLYREGEPAEFDSGMVLENGSYEMRIFGSEDRNGSYGSFRFRVENDFGNLAAGKSEVSVVVQPPLVVKYRQENHMYRYTLPDGEYFELSIPAGAWHRGQVRMNLSDNLNAYQIYRNGEVMEYSEEMLFDREGSYEIVLWDNELGLNGETCYKIHIGFRLFLNEEVSADLMNAPVGFRIEAVSFNGKQIPSDSGYFLMEKDGRYHFNFRSADDTLFWETEFVRDTTAPCLRFSVPPDGQELHEEISYTPSEPDAVITIFRNGEEVTASMNRIAVNGKYRMTVSDRTGNTREYQFFMHIGSPVTVPLLIIIPIILLIAGGALYLHWKKDMTVL